MMADVVLASRPQAFLIALLAILTLAFFTESILKKKAGLSISASLGLTLVLCFAGGALLMLPGPARNPDSSIIWLLDIDRKGYVTKDAGTWEEFLEISLMGNLKWQLFYLRGVFGASVVMLGIPLLITIYQKWFGGIATPAELQPGRAGIRAWFAGSSRWAAALVMVGLWMWADVSLAVSFSLWMLLLGAYPVAQWVKSEWNAEATATPLVENAEESDKERILRMVEQGTITGAEGAALLQALPRHGSGVGDGQPYRFGHARKVVALGAALVLVGFFLPWMKVNLAAEFDQIMTGTGNAAVIEQMQGSFGKREHEITRLIGDLQKLDVDAQHWAQTGGLLKEDIKLRGSHFTSGWVFLVLVGVVACVYLLPNDFGRKTQDMILAMGAAAAGVALLYPAMHAPTYLALGFVLSLAGYGLIGIAVWQRIQRSLFAA